MDKRKEGSIMSKTSAQVTGHMTISNSNKLPMDTKGKVLSAPEGHVRKFKKVLIDPETNKEVVIQGVARIGGCDKNGKPLKDRKQSLTCYVAFKLNGVESLLAPVETKTESSDGVDLDAMAESLGLDLDA